MSDYSQNGRRARSRLPLVVGVVLAGLLAGCSPTSNGGNNQPSPTPSAAPARSVTATNLLTVEDVEGTNDDPMTKQAVEAAEGQGRPVSQSYICLPQDGLASLGATSMVTRDFTFKIINADSDPYPKSPLKNKPSVYTQALQFADEPAATAARATYAGWIKDCPKTLLDRGYGVDDGQSLKLTTLKKEGGSAQAGMVAYTEPGVKDTEDLYWESAGLTQVKDRLMVTITVGWGMDTPGTFDESEGDFVNPLAYLIEYSIERLQA